MVQLDVQHTVSRSSQVTVAWCVDSSHDVGETDKWFAQGTLQ